MIKLTGTEEKPIYLYPEHVVSIKENERIKAKTLIDTGHGSCLVKETPEEVARKVFEYKLAMERIKAALLTDKKEIAMSEYQNLKRLAGLEEPNND